MVKITAQEFYRKLTDEFHLKEAQGTIRFNLRALDITIKQNSTVGNIIEEWLANWAEREGIDCIHNKKTVCARFLVGFR